MGRWGRALVEATIGEVNGDHVPFRWQRAAAVGADYTFGVGNGLGVIAEHMMVGAAAEPFGRGPMSDTHVSALVLSYPIGILDNLRAIALYDWRGKGVYRYLAWQRTLDSWLFSVSAFWNPDTPASLGAPGGGGAGKGIQLMDGDGLSLIPELRERCPQTRILVLTSFTDETTLLRVIDSGVNGFVSKIRPMTELLVGIRQAAAGEIVMPQNLLLGLLARPPQPVRGLHHPPLTPREREILRLLAQGKAGAAIAAELKIAPLTVRTHIRNLFDKLGVHSRLEAVTQALRQGLIQPPL